MALMSSSSFDQSETIALIRLEMPELHHFSDHKHITNVASPWAKELPTFNVTFRSIEINNGVLSC